MGRSLVSLLTKLLREEDGPTAVEYAVMLALIIVVVIGGILQVSNQAGGMYAGINGDLGAAGF